MNYTKRYRLGQLLSTITRHFLLMTATPHNGKEADFQLFMALLVHCENLRQIPGASGTLATLGREIGTPRAKAFLDYFNSLQRSLWRQIEDQRHAGNTKYAGRCDGLLNELTRGRMDYRQSGAASGAE